MPLRRGRNSRTHELEGLVQRARNTIARAKALRARAELARKKADAVYTSASAACFRSGGRSASLIHDLENASHELQILQSRIDSVMKQTLSPALSTAAVETKARAPLLAIHGSSRSTSDRTGCAPRRRPLARGRENQSRRPPAADVPEPPRIETGRTNRRGWRGRQQRGSETVSGTSPVEVTMIANWSSTR